MIVPRRPVPARVLLVDDEVQQLAVRAHVMKASALSVITACGPIEAIWILAGTMEEIEYSGAVDIPQSKMTSVDARVMAHAH